MSSMCSSILRWSRSSLQQAFRHFLKVVHDASRELLLMSFLLGFRPHCQGAAPAHHKRRNTVIPSPWNDGGVFIWINVQEIASTAIIVVVAAVLKHLGTDLVSIVINQCGWFGTRCIESLEAQSCQEKSDDPLHVFSLLSEKRYFALTYIHEVSPYEWRVWETSDVQQTLWRSSADLTQSSFTHR